MNNTVLRVFSLMTLLLLLEACGRTTYDLVSEGQYDEIQVYVLLDLHGTTKRVKVEEFSCASIEVVELLRQEGVLTAEFLDAIMDSDWFLRRSEARNKAFRLIIEEASIFWIATEEIPFDFELRPKLLWWEKGGGG